MGKAKRKEAERKEAERRKAEEAEVIITGVLGCSPAHRSLEDYQKAEQLLLQTRVGADQQFRNAQAELQTEKDLGSGA